MKLLDLSLANVIEDVALDDALLESAEATDASDIEVLRLWEPTANGVVIGRSSRIDSEVNREACRREGVPIVRRTSGGLAVVAGPGCLMYSVVLSLKKRPELQPIDQAHCFVLQNTLKAVRSLGVDAACQGSSDLTVGDRKFSGNSLRYRRSTLLYHGTLLNTFDLDWITKLLKTPSRQPEYRQSRSHADFVANLGLDPAALKKALAQVWSPDGILVDWPEPVMRRFVAERFSQDAWNARR